jgi:hypothetical protein
MRKTKTKKGKKMNIRQLSEELINNPISPEYRVLVKKLNKEVKEQIAKKHGRNGIDFEKIVSIVSYAFNHIPISGKKEIMVSRLEEALEEKLIKA